MKTQNMDDATNKWHDVVPTDISFSKMCGNERVRVFEYLRC